MLNYFKPVTKKVHEAMTEVQRLQEEQLEAERAAAREAKKSAERAKTPAMRETLANPFFSDGWLAASRKFAARLDKRKHL